MNKEEFLQKLQDTLSSEVPPEIVRENLQYYSRYIRDERQKGRTEAEIMEELGDPRMIARTIIDTTPGGGGNFEEYTGSFGFGDWGYTSRQDSSTDAGSYESGTNQQTGSFHVYDLNKWYYKVLAIVILIAIMTVIIAIVSGILSLLIPLLPVILVVMILMWFLRGI
jgi:hypothetical protein